MKLFKRNSNGNSQRLVAARCHHPRAVIIDPSERQLTELEIMLARCPNCSQWHPGQGPIMAVLTSRQDFSQNSSKHYIL